MPEVIRNPQAENIFNRWGLSFELIEAFPIANIQDIAGQQVDIHLVDVDSLLGHEYADHPWVRSDRIVELHAVSSLFTLPLACRAPVPNRPTSRDGSDADGTCIGGVSPG